MRAFLSPLPFLFVVCNTAPIPLIAPHPNLASFRRESLEAASPIPKASSPFFSRRPPDSPSTSPFDPGTSPPSDNAFQTTSQARSSVEGSSGPLTNAPARLSSPSESTVSSTTGQIEAQAPSALRPRADRRVCAAITIRGERRPNKFDGVGRGSSTRCWGGSAWTHQAANVAHPVSSTGRTRWWRHC